MDTETTKTRKPVRLTDTFARSGGAHVPGRDVWYCNGKESSNLPGALYLRVSPKNARSWTFRVTVGTNRAVRTIGPAGDGSGGTFTIEMAREKVREWRDLMRDSGTRDINAILDAEKIATAADARTFADALRDYVKSKRRVKDGLALKARTVRDYLGMIDKAPHGKLQPLLFDIAVRPIKALTGQEIRNVYKTALERSTAQANYAMRIVRAVFNEEGVSLPDDPFAKTTPGKHRIRLPGTKGRKNPIPAEARAAWWKAAQRVGSDRARDLLRFLALTGCRIGEILGSVEDGYAPVRVADVDRAQRRIVLRDTKNRRDHALQLSTQAMAIVTKHCEGCAADEQLFDISETAARSTMQRINAAAGLERDAHSPHDLRATVISMTRVLPIAPVIAEDIVNHAADGVSREHYHGDMEAEARAAWQAIADAWEKQDAAGK
jgi:integrase